MPTSQPTSRAVLASPSLAYTLALVAGLLYPLGFAPLGLWPLTLLSIAGLLLLLQRRPASESFWLGWWYGFGSYGVGVSWVYVSIHFYGHTPLALAVLMTAIFAAGLALLPALLSKCYRMILNRRWAWLLFPSLWVLFDWVKTWLLSGFPWLFPGYALIDTPLQYVAPIAGVFAVSWLSVFSATMLAGCWGHWKNWRYMTATGFALTAGWVGCLCLGQIHWTQPLKSQPIQVAMVQGNIPQEQKWDPNERENILATYVEASDLQWGADLIIWPEAAFPVFYQDAQALISQLDARGKASDTAFVSGAPFWEYRAGQFDYYNTVFAAGAGSGFYHKQVLVPFGEYVPLEGLLRGLMPFFDLPMSSFTPGDKEQPPLQVGSHTLAPFICYEIVYPELVRRLGARADLLLTISNDAWFGRSWGPHQHFEIARMRALELGKYLLRGTNTGITAIINPDGDVISRLPQFEVGILRGAVYPMAGSTPFSKVGSWPVLLFSLLLVLLRVVAQRRHQLDGQSMSRLPG